jgi:hypothetical protein
MAGATVAADLDPPFDRVYPLVAPEAPVLGHQGIVTGAAVVARRPCARGCGGVKRIARGLTKGLARTRRAARGGRPAGRR